jgi:hypothetical protein
MPNHGILTSLILKHTLRLEAHFHTSNAIVLQVHDDVVHCLWEMPRILINWRDHRSAPVEDTTLILLHEYQRPYGPFLHEYLYHKYVIDVIDEPSAYQETDVLSDFDHHTLMQHSKSLLANADMIQNKSQYALDLSFFKELNEIPAKIFDISKFTTQLTINHSFVNNPGSLFHRSHVDQAPAYQHVIRVFDQEVCTLASSFRAAC